MNYLLGLIGFLIASVGYLFIKNKSASVLLENLDVKNKLNDLDKDRSKNDGLLAAEEKKREELKNDAAAKNQPISPKDFN